MANAPPPTHTGHAHPHPIPTHHNRTSAHCRPGWRTTRTALSWGRVGPGRAVLDEDGHGHVQQPRNRNGQWRGRAREVGEAGGTRNVGKRGQCCWGGPEAQQVQGGLWLGRAQRYSTARTSARPHTEEDRWGSGGRAAPPPPARIPRTSAKSCGGGLPGQQAQHRRARPHLQGCIRTPAPSQC